MPLIFKNMLNNSAADLIALLIKYRYLIIFPIAVVEGPLVSAAAGFLVFLGYLNGFFTYVLLILADMVGDTLYYALGRFGGRKFVKKFGHYIGVDEKKLGNLEKQFERHSGKIILGGKTQAIGAVALIAAGMAKMPYRGFMKYNFLGSIPKVLLFLAIGYFFGQGYSAMLDKYVNYVGLISFLAAVALIVFYFLVRRYLRAKDKINK
jgi:membrane protein DedA with SNARE-associated domain